MEKSPFIYINSHNEGGRPQSFDNIVGVVNSKMWGVNLVDIDSLRDFYGGECSWNFNVIVSALFLSAKLKEAGSKLLPIVTTQMPRTNTKLESFLKYYLSFKNDTQSGHAGLVILIGASELTHKDKDINKILLRVVGAEGLQGDKIVIVNTRGGEGLGPLPSSKFIFTNDDFPLDFSDGLWYSGLTK